jgi:hypothetical protein
VITTAAVFLLALGAVPDEGSSKPASPAATPAPASASAGDEKTGPSSGKGDLDFDLFGASPPPLAPAVDLKLAREVERRRTLLTYHQAAGIGLLVAMGATTVLGALDYHELYGGGSGSRRYVWPHRIGVIVTTVEFAGAGTLAMLAPQPYEKDVGDRGFSPGTVHRAATFLATLGMATQLGVGFVTARRAEAGNPHDLQTLARTHEVVGYVTMGLVAVAAGAWLF